MLRRNLAIELERLPPSVELEVSAQSSSCLNLDVCLLEQMLRCLRVIVIHRQPQRCAASSPRAELEF
eukprot:CAMPEP_0181187562 /NCGR_PEP_ID=MMETSP1096-20121128/10640_1 /TAXON_ID=156174 ORGANISM="Chrysochromulina ericina, Strain CCMP281" /NCGR_SAMPLE_ID=MMETSP1096 /ASSEMBLY_ACC=CAM_ASM_000453 /LENGTH=66 /DNA_ID=CAMNT_0023276547 /DNA_START=815 /DNA_END=1012 /DNA_ORIENTATION=-